MMNPAQAQQKPLPVPPGGERHLLSLPDELLVQVVSYLPPHSTIPLHSTCRRLRGLTRQDPTLWRSLCAYQEALDSHPSLAAPTPPPSPPANGITNIAPIPISAAAWPIPGIDDAEKIDWYNEYKFRHAPLKMRWFCAGADEANVEVGLQDEVKGITVFSSASGGAGKNDMLLSSLSDGSICIWSLKDTAAGHGRKAVARSKPGLVFSDHGDEKWQARRKAREAEIVDGVSLDSVTGKVWIAGEEGLIEIDLNTLQKVSTHRFPFSIQTLSQTSHPYPLTVGTTLALHLHDPRVSVPASTATFSDGYHSTPSSDDERVQFRLQPSHPFRKNYRFHAPLFQPGPLSILHSDPPSGGSDGDGEIYVAGRFPSILCYERRMWPKLRGTIHSGGRLCALAKIPYSPTSTTAVPSSPISSIPSSPSGDSEWKQDYENEQQRGTQVTLLASGEYNGRGTLEIYPLRTTPSSFRTHSSSPSRTHRPTPSVIKNRQTASRSKLLTVASHGARIVTGDADGVIKWVERDGRMLVRAFVVEAPEKQNTSGSSGLWGSVARSGGSGTTASGLPTGGEVVRKVVVAKEGGEELVVWAGDRVGVLGSFGDDEAEEEEMEVEGNTEMETYLERMREALERQAAEVRIMAGLGMGGL